MDRQKQKSSRGSLHNPQLSSSLNLKPLSSTSGNGSLGISGGTTGRRIPSSIGAGKLQNPLLASNAASLSSSSTSPKLSSKGASLSAGVSLGLTAGPRATTTRSNGSSILLGRPALLGDVSSLSLQHKEKDERGKMGAGATLGRANGKSETDGTGTRGASTNSTVPLLSQLSQSSTKSTSSTAGEGLLSKQSAGSFNPMLSGSCTMTSLAAPAGLGSALGSSSTSSKYGSSLAGLGSGLTSTTMFGGTTSTTASSSLAFKSRNESPAKRLKKDMGAARMDAEPEERWESIPSSEFIELPEYAFPDKQRGGEERRGVKRKVFAVTKATTSIESPLADVNRLKVLLINTVAGSLIRQPDFRKPEDPTRIDLMTMANSLVTYDAEFVLKLALYTRCELNIRTTANFLLALASNVGLCRPYLKKYFKSSVRLPSDWIDVAELYQTFHDGSINYGALPVALRRAMADKFPDFDEYQLAKYNKSKSKKKKKKKPSASEDGAGRGGGRGGRGGRGRGRGRGRGFGRGRGRDRSFCEMPSESSSSDDDSSSSDSDSGDSDSELFEREESVSVEERKKEKERLVASSFTLKQLIRKIHITKPVKYIMALLGKRYPQDLDSFYRTHLDGTWDAEMAGKRMKLKTPETWETQISSRGNSAAVWQDLINHNKLPFMAMLRNIRNMILSGMDSEHHGWVLKKLSNRGAVASSKQFPFRFLAAYEVLEEVLANAGQDPRLSALQNPTPLKDKKAEVKRKIALRRLNTRPILPEPVVKQLVADYRKALDTAVRLATKHNVAPIRGRTLVLVNGRMEGTCTSAKGLGKPRSVTDVAYLLALMCYSACEHSNFRVFGWPGWIDRSVEDLISDNLLETVQVLTQNFAVSRQDAELAYPTEFFKEYLDEEKEIDNILMLSNGSPGEENLLSLVARYRQVVNPNLLYVSVDLSGSKPELSQPKSGHANDIFISGFSDQVLRFIADHGSDAQLTHVEHIDVPYNLKPTNMAAVAAAQANHAGKAATKGDTPMETGADDDEASPSASMWRTARVFISSTFRDMHGERDLLTRYVFPELRARARQRRVNVYEVDLRWGVTEKESQNNKSLDVCLTEVNKCNFFVGLLGERYGWCPSTYYPPAGEEFDWVHDYPEGRSVTELEMQHAALNDSAGAGGKAFFHFRDPSFIKDMPSDMRTDFASESSAARSKMDSLKKRVTESGLEVTSSYTCRWGGMADGKPMVVGLEAFGQLVLEQLWNAIELTFPEEEETDWFASERILHSAFAEHRLLAHLPRTNLIKQCVDTVRKGHSSGGLLVIKGEAGSGKSTLLASVLREMRDKMPTMVVVSHYCGAAPGSTFLPHMLRRICRELCTNCRLPDNLPEEVQELLASFPSLLKDATMARGSGCRIVIAIDGIDTMDAAYQAQSLQWLPCRLPPGVVVVVTAAGGGKVTDAVATRSVRPLDTVIVSGLSIAEKMDVVRSSLALHRKTLDESPFNNQMKLLVTKKESTSPFYLSLACEELRVFGVFEKVNDHIKQLPSAVPQLLQGVLKRLEGDHGSVVMKHIMLLLSCARDGLMESELQMLLTLCSIVLDSSVGAPVAPPSRFGSKAGSGQVQQASVVECSKLAAELTRQPKRLLPPSSVSHLLRSVQVLLQPTAHDSDGQLKLAHNEIRRAISQRYLQGITAVKQASVHAILAGYYLSLADPDMERSWNGTSVRALSELPYHLAASDSWPILATTVTDLPFLQAKADAGLAGQLLQDFFIDGPPLEMTSTRLRNFNAQFQSVDKVQAYHSFLSRSIHIIMQSPSLLWQQAANEPTESVVTKDALHGKSLSGDSSDWEGVMLWGNKPESVDNCALTLPEFAKAVSCLAMSLDGKVFVCGGLDCSVKIYQAATGKEIQSFVGHGTPLSACCFVGRDRLCTASQDGSISLWDLSSGHRVSVMTDHKRRVGGCAADPSGKLFVSVGWDGMLILWSSTDGSKMAGIPVADCPINCVAFHPEGQFVVLGCWDSKLVLYDTLNRRKTKTLKGHRTAVRTAAYARDGRHIASAALDGDVMLWEVKSGQPVGRFVGHAMPINQLSFTPNGKYLITVADDWKIKVWSSHLGKPVSRQAYPGRVSAVCRLPNPDSDGTALDVFIVGCHDGSVSLSDGSATLSPELVPHSARVTCIAATPDGLVVTGSEDKMVKVLRADRSSNSLTVVATLTGHEDLISSVVCTKKAIVSTSHDFTSRVWPMKKLQTATNGKPAAPPAMTTSLVLRDHDAPVTCCDVSADGAFLATAGRDKKLNIYREGIDEGTFALDNSIDTKHSDWVSCLCFAPAGDQVVTGSVDFTLALHDLKTGATTATFTGHQAAINCVKMKRGCIVSGSAVGVVKVWSHRGIELTTLRSHSDRINGVYLGMPDDDILIKPKKNSWEDKVRGEEKAATLPLDVAKVKVTSVSDDRTLQSWMPFLGHEVTCLTGHSGRVLSVAADSSSGLVTSGLDRRAKCWRIEGSDDFAKKSLFQGTVSHQDKVVGVSLSDSANRYVVSADRSGMVFIWRTMQSDSTHTISATVIYQLPTGQHLKSISFCFEKYAGSDELFFATGSTSGLSIWRFDIKLHCHKRLLSQSGDYHHVVGKDRCLVVSTAPNKISVYSGNPVTCGPLVSLLRLAGDRTIPKMRVDGKDQDVWIERLVLRSQDLFIVANGGRAVTRMANITANLGTPSNVPLALNKIKLPTSGKSLLENDGTLRLCYTEEKADLVVCLGDIGLTIAGKNSGPFDPDSLEQFAQFSCNAPVTSYATASPERNTNCLPLICGNSLGQVFFITVQLPSS